MNPVITVITQEAFQKYGIAKKTYTYRNGSRMLQLYRYEEFAVIKDDGKLYRFDDVAEAFVVARARVPKREGG